MADVEKKSAFVRVLRNLAIIGFQDVRQSFLMLHLVLFFAWGDTKARYRRSLLGPLWLVISTSISVAGLGFLWSMLLNQDSSKFVPSLTIGLVLWQFIAGCIVESSSVFVRNSHFIRNIVNPYTIYPLQLLTKNLINLAHSFVVIFVVILIYPQHIGAEQLLFIPGLMLVLANLLWICILLGIWGSRYRDIEQIVAALMPILFFISPVIYRPNLLDSSQQLIVWLNPFSYLLSLIRDPILGEIPDFFIYIISSSAALLGWLLVIFNLGQNKSKIAFWV